MGFHSRETGTSLHEPARQSLVKQGPNALMAGDIVLISQTTATFEGKTYRTVNSSTATNGGQAGMDAIEVGIVVADVSATANQLFQVIKMEETEFPFDRINPDGVTLAAKQFLAVASTNASGQSAFKLIRTTSSANAIAEVITPGSAGNNAFIRFDSVSLGRTGQSGSGLIISSKPVDGFNQAGEYPLMPETENRTGSALNFKSLTSTTNSIGIRETNGTIDLETHGKLEDLRDVRVEGLVDNQVIRSEVQTGLFDLFFPDNSGLSTAVESISFIFEFVNNTRAGGMDFIATASGAGLIDTLRIDLTNDNNVNITPSYDSSTRIFRIGALVGTGDTILRSGTALVSALVTLLNSSQQATDDQGTGSIAQLRDSAGGSWSAVNNPNTSTNQNLRFEPVGVLEARPDIRALTANVGASVFNTITGGVTWINQDESMIRLSQQFVRARNGTGSVIGFNSIVVLSGPDSSGIYTILGPPVRNNPPNNTALDAFTGVASLMNIGADNTTIYDIFVSGYLVNYTLPVATDFGPTNFEIDIFTDPTSKDYHTDNVITNVNPAIAKVVGGKTGDFGTTNGIYTLYKYGETKLAGLLTRDDVISQTATGNSNGNPNLSLLRVGGTNVFGGTNTNGDFAASQPFNVAYIKENFSDTVGLTPNPTAPVATGTDIIDSRFFFRSNDYIKPRLFQDDYGLAMCRLHFDVELVVDMPGGTDGSFVIEFQVASGAPGGIVTLVSNTFERPASDTTGSTTFTDSFRFTWPPKTPAVQSPASNPFTNIPHNVFVFRDTSQGGGFDHGFRILYTRFNRTNTGTTIAPVGNLTVRDQEQSTVPITNLDLISLERVW